MQNWFGFSNPYVYRNDNLARMGFTSYRAYLASALWKGIKRRVMERDQFKCVKCHRLGNQVHHRAYDPATLRGDDINSLSTVCARCHKRAERPDDFKRTAQDRLSQSSFEIAHKVRDDAEIWYDRFRAILPRCPTPFDRYVLFQSLPVGKRHSRRWLRNHFASSPIARRRDELLAEGRRMELGGPTGE